MSVDEDLGWLANDEEIAALELAERMPLLLRHARDLFEERDHYWLAAMCSRAALTIENQREQLRTLATDIIDGAPSEGDDE